MVGDTISDFNAARQNGIESVAVTWGYGKKEELAIADRLASAPDEI
jgi:phosphoglycolate phosphatase-like HAD superfamily hydrolase